MNVNFASPTDSISSLSVSGVDDALFERGFEEAGIVKGQTYYDPVRGVDLRKNMLKTIKKKREDRLQKDPSITTGGTYTSYSLMPTYLMPDIVDQTMYETPLVFWTRRVASKGLYHAYNKLTAKTQAKFQGPDSPLTPLVDTRSNASVEMKCLYAPGRVLGLHMAAASHYISLLQEDLRAKTAAMNEALEDEIINGNTTTNAYGFQGLVQTISTNTTDLSAANIELSDMRDMLADLKVARGRSDLIVTDPYTHNYVKGLLMDYQRFIERPTEKMPFGIPGSFVFDGAVVIDSQFLTTTSGSRRMLFLDSRYMYLAVLQDMTYTEKDSGNDSEKYYLKWYGSLVVTYEGSMGQIYGIK